MVSLREHLGSERTTHIPIGGELRHENAEVVARQRVGSRWGEEVPSGALVVIHDEAVAGFEGVVPAACEQGGIHLPIRSGSGAIQANGDPAVIGQIGQQGECRCADVVGRGATEDAFLVERRRGRERQGEFVVPDNGRNAVGGGDGGEVHAVRGQPCQFPAGVLKHGFDLDAVPRNACAERHAPRFCTRAEIARTVVVRRSAVVVAGRGVGAAFHFEGVTNAVTIGISQAVSVAIVPQLGQNTRPIVLGGRWVIVARVRVGATQTRNKVASAVVVSGFGVVVACGAVGAAQSQATLKLTRAIILQSVLVKVAGARVGAASAIVGAGVVVLRGAGAVVARVLVRASQRLKFITRSIAIRVVEACPVATVRECWVGTCAVVVSRCVVVVARIFVCAPKRKTADKVAAARIWEHGTGVEVARQLDGAPRFVGIADVVGVHIVALCECRQTEESREECHEEGAKDRGGGTGGTVHLLCRLCGCLPRQGNTRVQKIQKSVDKIPDFSD